MTPTKILLVEDDASLRRFLRLVLDASGFHVSEAVSAFEGIAMSRSHSPDLILLDLGLPDRDGMEALKDLRSWFENPILILSARNRELDKVQALDAGADDYLVKPFGANELLARIRVALRHGQRKATGGDLTIFSFGDVVLNIEARTVLRAGEAIHLTPQEWALFVALANRAGKVCTHAQLLKEVWGPSHQHLTHYLRIFMAQLRHKLEYDPARPRYLLTETGVGYRMKVD